MYLQPLYRLFYLRCPIHQEHGLTLGCWILNSRVPASKPLGGFKVNSVFHPSEADQMSTSISRRLSGKTLTVLETVEPRL